jgi:O-antigen ligase
MEQIILFIFFIIFPFGQIIRIGILQPIDAVAGAGAVWAILKHYKKPEIFKYFNIFLLIALFSWILSVFIFQGTDVLYGGLYLVRLAAYFYFFVFVWHFAKKNKANRSLLINSLLLISVVSAIFGWVQYLIIPDTRALVYLGWDMHFLRLIGSFLDPPFIGLIIVLGLIISIIKFVEKKSKLILVLAIFLLISVAFTYSRGSYVALFAGLFVIGVYKRKLKLFLSIILGLTLLIFVLPTSQNHILGVLRTFSIEARLSDYSKTLDIFRSSPLFGVGYDNLCLAKAKMDGGVNFFSHNCSGSNSSLLTVLATTGIVGFIAYIFLLFQTFKLAKYGVLYASCLVVFVISGFFNNTMFYPWIMGYMFILLAVGLRGEV